MSIRISNAGSAAHLGAASRSPVPLSPERQAFRDLGKSLKAGDLDGAKQAYASMVKNAPDGATWKSDSAFAQLGKALNSGDVSAAQDAFKSMVKGHVNGPVSQPVVPPSTSTLVNLVA